MTPTPTDSTTASGTTAAVATAADATEGVDPLPASFRDAVAARLAAFVQTKADELAPIGPSLAPLLEAAEASVSGGKRLRPAFTYWGWRAAGADADDTDAVMTAAAAIELVHASALIHDDVMDDSSTRRGEPAAHRRFSRSLGTVPGGGRAEQFGRSAAILLGDLLLSWSDELLGQSGFKPKSLARGRFYFDRLRTEVVAGQYLDVLAQTRSTSSVADAMRVVRYKSAKYTVERPLQFGAALADGRDALLSALSSYGVPLGEAFQLRDDVLGVFGESDVTGKPSGDDIREGKRTLLMARAFDAADRDQAKVLTRTFGNPSLTDHGLRDVQRVLRDSGALDAVETVIAELTAAALAALDAAPIGDDEARTALRMLTDRATNRAH